MKATLAKPTDRTIHTERIFNAPRDVVWRAFSEPELVAQWWGRGNQLDIEKFDFEPGGQWRFVERSDDGEFAFHGEYREITPNERLVQTFEWDGTPGHAILETMVLEDLGDGRTKIVNTSQFESAEERDAMLGYGMESGMNESYDALDRLLATLV